FHHHGDWEDEPACLPFVGSRLNPVADAARLAQDGKRAGRQATPAFMIGRKVGMRSTQGEKDQIRAYVREQAHDDVAHLEKVASELVGPVRHDIWDAHCPGTRWWVV